MSESHKFRKLTFMAFLYREMTFSVLGFPVWWLKKLKLKGSVDRQVAPLVLGFAV